MKKMIIVLTISMLWGACVNAQTMFRRYEGIYTVDLKGEKETKKSIISVTWKNNKATDIDNMDGIVYPDGYVMLRSYFKYLQTVNGYDQFTAEGSDEKGRQVTVGVTKYSTSYINIVVYYNKNLSFVMLIDLEKFTIE